MGRCACELGLAELQSAPHGAGVAPEEGTSLTCPHVRRQLVNAAYLPLARQESPVVLRRVLAQALAALREEAQLLQTWSDHPPAFLREMRWRSAEMRELLAALESEAAQGAPYTAHCQRCHEAARHEQNLEAVAAARAEVERTHRWAMRLSAAAGLLAHLLPALAVGFLAGSAFVTGDPPAPGLLVGALSASLFVLVLAQLLHLWVDGRLAAGFDERLRELVGGAHPAPGADRPSLSPACPEA